MYIRSKELGIAYKRTARDYETHSVTDYVNNSPLCILAQKTGLSADHDTLCTSCLERIYGVNDCLSKRLKPHSSQYILTGWWGLNVFYSRYYDLVGDFLIGINSTYKVTDKVIKVPLFTRLIMHLADYTCERAKRKA